jgi:hypothetical protein
MQRRASFSSGELPLKYKTRVASSESIDPKRDRHVESHLSKNERWATGPFDLRSFCGKIRFCCSIPRLLLLFLERVLFPDTG